MKLTPITPDISLYPAPLHPFLSGASLFDSSSSCGASVILIDKDCGYFLKSAQKNALKREASLTRWFHNKGLASQVLLYLSNEQDWLLTKRVPGQDCSALKYLKQPKRLCDILAERLRMLHNIDFSGCPVQNHTELYLKKAKSNYRNGFFRKELFPDNWGYASAQEAFYMLETRGHLLQTDTLLHGDYCLPNIILNNWDFSGFIDLDNGGVGDRHIDLFWALWTLSFNLNTNDYCQRFIDAYGKQEVDEEMLRMVAAAEVFS